MGKKTSGKAVLLLAVVIFLAGCAPGVSPSSTAGTPTINPHFFPIGSFVSGDWTLEFKADGTFTFSGPTEKYTGAYAADGNQVVFTTDSCGEVKGTYLWSFDGQRPMLLKAVDDPCRDRAELITSTGWWVKP